MLSGQSVISLVYDQHIPRDPHNCSYAVFSGMVWGLVGIVSYTMKNMNSVADPDPMMWGASIQTYPVQL